MKGKPTIYCANIAHSPFHVIHSNRSLQSLHVFQLSPNCINQTMTHQISFAPTLFQIPKCSNFGYEPLRSPRRGQLAQRELQMLLRPAKAGVQKHPLTCCSTLTTEGLSNERRACGKSASFLVQPGACLVSEDMSGLEGHSMGRQRGPCWPRADT